MRLIDADKADVERINCFYGSECRIEDVCEWLDEQPTINPYEWISVEDRLPDIEQIVLAVVSEPRERLNYPYKEDVLLLYRRGFNYITGYEIHWDRPFGSEMVNYDDIVTHWMPLPKPPTENNNVQNI